MLEHSNSKSLFSLKSQEIFWNVLYLVELISLRPNLEDTDKKRIGYFFYDKITMCFEIENTFIDKFNYNPNAFRVVRVPTILQCMLNKLIKLFTSPRFVIKLVVAE